MTVHYSHDHFFRDSFGRPEIIRPFLQEYLPPALRDALNLDTLNLVQQTFIDEELREHLTDLLYRVQMRDGKQIFIYLLFEHKSYPDRLVSLQLLRYMTRIWDDNRPRKQGEFLPPILPLVLYHGEQSWKIATDFHALFGDELPAVLAPYLPQFHYQLHDFSYTSSVEIRGEIWLRVCLYILRSIFNPDLRELLPDLVKLAFELSSEESGLDYIYTIMYYLSVATDKVDRESMQQALLTRGSQGDQIMMTLAQQWIEEGREQGREQGLEQGLEQGRVEGANRLAANLARMLQRKFDNTPATIESRLQQLTLPTLDQLFDVALDADVWETFEEALVAIEKGE